MAGQYRPQAVGEVIVNASGHWVLVLDTTLARVLRNLPAEGRPVLSELVLRSPEGGVLKLLSVPSEGHGARGDPMAEDRSEFVRQVVALLEAHRLAGEFGTLSVIARPRMLGLVRDAMPAPLVRLIDREVAGNLTRVLPGEITDLVRRNLGRSGRGETG